MTGPAIESARSVVANAIQGRVFPAAAVEAGSSTGVLWREAFGTLTFAGDAAGASIETPFDLASLTKPLATTTVVMDLVHAGVLGLDQQVATFFREWRGFDREQATVRDLLEHAAGLSARLVDVVPGNRREFEHDICTMPLEYAVRTGSIYSDLGFLLLGFLAEDRAGRALSGQFEDVMLRVGLDPTSLTFGRPHDARASVAPTLPMDDDRRRGRLLAGEVHDAYAAALGGVAGHAGLFGTAGAVGAFAHLVLQSARGEAGVPAPLSPDLVGRMTKKTSVPGSSRALGWDTMRPTSSCGTRMSASAFGHVGFTGTSLWIDPARDRYFVLLTNRVAGLGSLEEIRTVRRAFHEALGAI